MNAWAYLRLLLPKQFVRFRVIQKTEISRFASFAKARRETKFFSIHNHSRTSKWFCHAGLLTYLGLQMKPKTAEEEVTDIIKRAIVAHQENQTNTAEQLLHLALKIAQEQLYPLAATHIFDIMANFALDAGDHAKAERLFKEVLKRMLGGAKGEAVAEDDNAVIEISIKLASIYSETGRVSEAESGFDFCAQKLTAKMNTASASDKKAVLSPSPDSETADTAMLWAMYNDTLGRHLIKLGDVNKAIKHFAVALDTCQQVNGPDHPQTLILVNNLGSVSSMCGDQEAAAGYLAEAVRIAQVTASPDLAAYHRNLGMIYLQMGRLVEATEACKAALNESASSGSSEYRKEAYKCLHDIANIQAAVQK